MACVSKVCINWLTGSLFPAMLDFILAQPCPKILVGDPHQQIYAFRRAIDALSSVRATHTFYLTKVGKGSCVKLDLAS